MPFDFKSYDEKCNGLTPEELQREWQHYTRLISGAATSTAVSGIAVPFTLGVSTIGVAMAAPAIHNARKKREIIEKHLNKHNATHTTRKRDVLGSVAFSGTIGVVTLGVGSMGADAVATTGAEHGISAIMENETAIKIVTHAALDGAGMAAEHAHTKHLKKKDAFKAFKAAGVFNAVKDAKAAEAGYSISPYNPQGVNGGSSSSNPLPPPSEMLPPPPYNVAVGQTQFQPGYFPSQNAYAPDYKAPMSQSQVVQDPQLMTPAAYGQQPTTPQYFSQVPPPPTDPAATSTFPAVPVPSSYQQTSSGGYPAYTGQTAQGYQPAVPQQTTPLYPQSTGSSTLPAYNPTAPSGVYDMKSMSEALPTQSSAMATSYQQPPQGTPAVPHGRSQSISQISQPTPQAHPSTPVQPNHTGQTDQMPMGYPPPVQPISQPQSATPVLSSQSYVSGQSYVAEPAAPQVHTPVQAAQGHAMQHTPEYRTPATQGLQQGYQDYSSYTSPQQTGTYQGTNQAPPPPPPADSTRRDSAISTLQHSFTPQQYAPAPQQGYSYSTTPAQPQQPQFLPPLPPPPGPPPSGPVSQPPADFNATQTQQYSTGAYSALQSPVVQTQQQYQPVAPPQPYQQQCQQQPNHPPTPASLPNQPPVSQHQQQYQPNAPPQQYQPQYQQQPQSYNYPPTPASLPSQTPMMHQHTGSSYFPPPPTTKQSQPINAPQQGQQPWNGQVPGHMPYTPATSPGTMWQPQAISQIYPQHHQ